MDTLTLAKDGVFLTCQGEGMLMGLPMVFVRLAGCSVGCPQCDTDYCVSRRATIREITQEACVVAGTVTDWIWLTGGEPTDHDITALVQDLHGVGFKVALATAGIRPVHCGSIHGGVDFLSVSPHDPSKWIVRRGDQLNFVSGLNGFHLKDWEEELTKPHEFAVRYVTPCDGMPETLQECKDWVLSHAGWRLGIQAHKQWRMA